MPARALGGGAGQADGATAKWTYARGPKPADTDRQREFVAHVASRHGLRPDELDDAAARVAVGDLEREVARHLAHVAGQGVEAGLHVAGAAGEVVEGAEAAEGDGEPDLRRQLGPRRAAEGAFPEAAEVLRVHSGVEAPQGVGVDTCLAADGVGVEAEGAESGEERSNRGGGDEHRRVLGGASRAAEDRFGVCHAAAAGGRTPAAPSGSPLALRRGSALTKAHPRSSG